MRCLAVTLVLLWAAASPVLGGTIVGKIKAKGSGAPVAGATVRVLDSKYGAVTDTNGRFAIQNIPPGTYVLRIQMIGYESSEKSGVTVRQDTSTAAIDAALGERPISMAEVVVQARADRELESSGRLTEKAAGNVLNVITAQTIEHSTDLTAADALQRVPGLSLVRSQGEGEFLVMRGLEARYNNTLVDGIKIPSPEAKDRFVPLDIFPSALFERIEVNKALTPELAGDAIGGSTNLMMRAAPDHFVFTASAGEGGSESMLGTAFNTFDRTTVPLLDPQQVHGTVSSDDPLTYLKPRYIPKPSDFSSANMHFTNEKAPLDGNYSALIGDRFFGSSLGIIAAG
jgi:outer membrane receptor protein involved in Fe transport